MSDENTGLPDDIDALIDRQFATLSPRLRQAARFIVDNPALVALRSMREVAASAQVDPSTMVRLAQELGLPGYGPLRDSYRQKLFLDEAARTRRAKQIRSQKGTLHAETVVSEFLEQNRRNLASTFPPESAAALGEIAAMLRSARAIFVLGLRSLYPVSFFFHYVLRLFSDNSVLLTGTGGTFADDLRLAREGDVLLVFGYRPYSRDAMTAVRFARSQKLRIVAVTDSRVSPAAREADHVLVVANEAASLLPTVIPFLAVAETLATLMLGGAGNEAIRRLEKSERQLRGLRVYEDEAPRRRNPSR
ncbi:MAG: MurR/RpiR family transcriptional regulator [Rhodospirillales bacterium]|nr:MurR/RpiR family transcriptional regulator [Rhodospirillales bacterium]